MAKRVKQRTTNAETSSYEELVNERIVPSQPEGGQPDVIGDDEEADLVPHEQPHTAPEAEADNVPEAHLETLSVYKKLYPNNEVFHITTDGSVFLKSGLNDATNHQLTLTGDAKNLKSYNAN